MQTAAKYMQIKTINKWPKVVFIHVKWTHRKEKLEENGFSEIDGFLCLYRETPSIVLRTNEFVCSFCLAIDLRIMMSLIRIDSPILEEMFV